MDGAYSGKVIEQNFRKKFISENYAVSERLRDNGVNVRIVSK